VQPVSSINVSRILPFCLYVARLCSVAIWRVAAGFSSVVNPVGVSSLPATLGANHRSPTSGFEYFSGEAMQVRVASRKNVLERPFVAS